MLKKVYICFCILLVSIPIGIGNVFADETETKRQSIVVPEPIPGTSCKKIKVEATTSTTDSDHVHTSTKWECSFESGTRQALKVLGFMIKFFTALAGLVGVGFLVYNGILYSMGGMNQALKDSAKTRIVKTLLGLLLLFLSGYILQLIAPWVYK